MRAVNIRVENFCPIKDKKDLIVKAVLLGEYGRGRMLFPVVVSEDIITNGKINGEVTIGSTRSGKPKIIKATAEDKLWLDRVSTLTSYIRNGCGWVGALENSGITTIARGMGAFGDAGRIGEWDDVLISVPEKTWIRIKPSRGPARFKYYPVMAGDSTPVEVNEEGLDAFVECLDIDPPSSLREDYKRI